MASGEQGHREIEAVNQENPVNELVLWGGGGNTILHE